MHGGSSHSPRYDLMVQMWQKEESLRPEFEAVHARLALLVQTIDDEETKL